MKRFALWILIPTLAAFTIIVSITMIVGPTATHPATSTSDECRAEPNDPANWPACSPSPARPSWAPTANAAIAAMAMDSTKAAAWVRSHHGSIETYGTPDKTLNGGLIIKGKTELQDQGFELWGMPGQWAGAVS